MVELLESPITDVPIVVIDTETTGLFPGVGHRVVELAAIRLEASPGAAWQVTGQFSQLINPGRSMDADASRINRIYDEDLAGKPSFAEIADSFYSLLDDALLVAHNAQFDASFLGMELHILEAQGYLETTKMIPNPWLCTMMLARYNFHFGRNNLEHIARVLGVRRGRAHRAVADVNTTAEVFKRLIRDLMARRIVTVRDFLVAQGGSIYLPHYREIRLHPPINEALAGNMSLRILYDGPAGKKTHIVKPLYASEHAGKEYLIATCLVRQEQRTFRLDKILSAELVGEDDP
jgi:DNA polymerase III epsilon subunit family exonuclease